METASVIHLSFSDLCIAAFLILLLAGLSLGLKLKLEWKIGLAASRTVVQLLIVGLILKVLFSVDSFLLVLLVAFVMLAVAGREVGVRQKRPFSGIWGYGTGTVSMFISSFTVTIFVLAAVIGNSPWYSPRYAIPLLGMILGNTMNGVSLGLDRLTQAAWEQRAVIEQKLMLGFTKDEAVSDIRRESIRNGMIPTLNSMAVAGIVSLPGMMTGQILGGTPPVEAVKYQILIMFMISAGAGFGTAFAVWFASKRLFDERHRLRLDRLKKTQG